jgi:hypothetical protein
VADRPLAVAVVVEARAAPAPRASRAANSAWLSRPPLLSNSEISLPRTRAPSSLRHTARMQALASGGKDILGRTVTVVGTGRGEDIRYFVIFITLPSG